jgi:hypothetical protein
MGIFSSAISRTLPGDIESPVINSAWQIPISPAERAQPAFPLLITKRMSQFFTASMQTSQESQVPPFGGVSSLIQASKNFLPKISILSISDFNSLRIFDKVVVLPPNGKKSSHRLEIITWSLFDVAIVNCTSAKVLQQSAGFELAPNWC